MSLSTSCSQSTLSRSFSLSCSTINSNSNVSSPECEAILRLYHRITRTMAQEIQNVLAITISKVTVAPYESIAALQEAQNLSRLEKAEKLMLMIIERVNTKPEVFNLLLEILGETDTLGDIKVELETAHNTILAETRTYYKPDRPESPTDREKKKNFCHGSVLCAVLPLVIILAICAAVIDIMFGVVSCMAGQAPCKSNSRMEGMSMDYLHGSFNLLFGSSLLLCFIIALILSYIFYFCTFFKKCLGRKWKLVHYGLHFSPFPIFYQRTHW